MNLMTSKDTKDDSRPYVVQLTRSFLYVSLATSVILAFGVGRVARISLLKEEASFLAQHSLPFHEDHSKVPQGDFPVPVLPDGKDAPRTLYTAKNFDTSSGSSSSSVHLETKPKPIDKSQKSSVCSSNDDSNDTTHQQCSQLSTPELASPSSTNNVEKVSVEEGEHLPSGQHLLVDIKNVDGTFLNSEVRLAQAMVDVINESKLTLLSYHCHHLTRMGVSCVGVLLESHIAFHTWPEEGVITLDLFTCGSGELVPVLPLIKRLFGVPQVPREKDDIVDPPRAVWSHKLRGFGDDKNPLGDDLGLRLLERTDLDFKEEVRISWFIGFLCFALLRYFINNLRDLFLLRYWYIDWKHTHQVSEN